MTKKKYGIRTVNGNEPDPETGNINVSVGGSQDLQSVLDTGHNATNAFMTIGDKNALYSLIASTNVSTLDVNFDRRSDLLTYGLAVTNNSENDYTNYYKDDVTHSTQDNLKSNKLVWKRLTDGNSEYKFPEKPSGSYILATKDEIPNPPTLQDVVNNNNNLSTQINFIAPGVTFPSFINSHLLEFNDSDGNQVLLNSKVLQFGSSTINTKLNGSGNGDFYFPDIGASTSATLATTDDLKDATNSIKGLVRLNGDLGGTADGPTVPALSGKQTTLVSGTNIKTINGTSLLGSGNLSVGSSLKSFSIFDDNFEDGTASLTLSTGWSVGNDGIAISTGGGWGNSALLNKYTTIDRVSSRALVQIINTASIFSLIRKPTTLNQFGTVAQVDCSTSMLKIYTSWDGSSTIPTVAKSISIPFSIIANRKYLLELKKNKAFTTFTFTDTTNLNNTISLMYNQETEIISGIGRQWGAPGVMFNSGSIKLKRFTYATEFPNAPKVLVTGHSFVEGYALYAEGDSSKTYSNLLLDSLNGDVAIAGRGGEDISTINTRNDIDFFSPTYHLVDIGSNDTVYATWLAGIQTYISKIQASGAIPVLATIAPRSDRQTFINQANDWIRLGTYNYVDFAKALTVNNDGLTQDASLFWTDYVHPNIAGNARMFQQLKIDAPYLWDGNTKPQAAVVNLDISEVSKTASFTVSLTDSTKLYVINSSSTVVVTFPTGMTSGKWWEFISIGTGTVSFVAGSSATLISPDNRLKLRAQYSQARIVARVSNQGALGGDIVL
ncbi:lysophospholipase L1-like esterase [Flavobacterium sp. 9]|uniref:SGNH/GDSL hydrolase family protein n=1 Tax=Flavobacterium sp. 9 TaxID=2035198 RepID=UPI000C173FAC|nr:SGNH/GDSL hydrolase family protein [Flavobacterium sp. 9]PIF30756.1 lysophospholipase L1-like esterase [Flavobacterium sp. 9]